MQEEEERFVVLDTELTSLEIHNGDRVISVGSVELFHHPENGFRLGECKEWIINPEGQKSHPKAVKIHGMSDDFLAKEPTFKEQHKDISDFISDSTIVHHCWPYNFLNFSKDPTPSVDEFALNVEFTRISMPTIPHEQWLNMKPWAGIVSKREDNDQRLKAAGKDELAGKDSLDAMLAYFGIENSARENSGIHTAIDDALVTAELYMKMAPEFMGLKAATTGNIAKMESRQDTNAIDTDLTAAEIYQHIADNTFDGLG